ncbi:MAG TPA: YeaH/YhbH family protein [Alphaproteobacteria bacterium]|nr:YeaH/YhbH family protein [Alphaproteobacteria bacterium]
MHHFIDRRANPKDKSLGNRQRFLRRARARIKEVVNRSVQDRNVTDVATGETITIPAKGIEEPQLRNARSGGNRSRVFTGNREYMTGDQIDKPESGEGKGGKQGSDDGEGEEDFRFTLSRDEFLDLFFEDLELPDLVKTSLKEVHSYKLHRAGHSASGTPTNLNVLRTMRNAHGRRIALHRPSRAAVERLEQEVTAMRAQPVLDEQEQARLLELEQQLETLQRRLRIVPYIDPVDIRYNRYEPRPNPNTKAVMFCLMDVSGSMGEREKDLAKRFFMLLHLFLERRYKRIEVVFIRHTHHAEEVDEQTFFYSPETGGTVVSTALVEMQRIIKERFPTGEWNIYAAQASDGENFSGDSERCHDLMVKEIMPMVQYYAYIEILDEREFDIFQDARSGAALWRAYGEVADAWKNFAMKRIAKPGDIYPVFRELFSHKAREKVG